jgi:hypothetical protein
MRRFGIGLLWAIVGYFAVACASYFLVLQFSPNTHDRSVEAAMTSVFFYGPVGAVVAFVVGFIRTGSAGPTGEP